MTFVPTAPETTDEVYGSIEPRIYTPPLRELTPETSYGFDVIKFADEVLEFPPDPWQRWLLIHAGELLPDGRPRFRKVLVLVARQNGKTTTPVILSIYWQFKQHVPLILGTSTKLDYAKESWQKTIDLVEGSKYLDGLHLKRWYRKANGEQESWSKKGSRYKIAASNPQGGRSLTVHRLILDELRQHHSYEAWDASIPAGNAVRDFQAWALSNAGDDRSVVLNDLRDSALEFIETGVGDKRFGLFEWSAPEGADPTDVMALAQANPNLGYRIDADVLLGDAMVAVARGGDALTGFKTENMCIRVPKLNPAIDPDSWREGAEAGDLSAVRSRVALCLDIAPSQTHATLCAAAVLADGRVRLEVVESWTGPGCTDQLRRALPDLLARVKPQTLGWLPNGPAAALAADLAERKGRVKWPPPGITVAEIRGETSAACMGLAELVTSKQIAHNNDPLLNAHIGEAERLMRGDAWVFSRKGSGNVDAAYAAAGAVFLARTLPPPIGKPRIIVSE